MLHAGGFDIGVRCEWDSIGVGKGGGYLLDVWDEFLYDLRQSSCFLALVEGGNQLGEGERALKALVTMTMCAGPCSVF